MFDVVNKVAPTKTIRIKNNANKWFDGEIAEKIAAPDKLFRKFIKSKLSVGEILCKEVRNTVQALVKDKKRKLLQDKLSENIGKQKDLRKIIKKIELCICLNTKKELTFSPRTIANTFKKRFADLASDLVKKLPDPTRKSGIPSVRQCTRELTSVKINLNLKKLVLCQF